MIRFLLLRHGQSLSNLGDFFTGQLDVDLTPFGYKQARVAADYIAAHYRVDTIYCSPLQRAVHTVEPFAGRVGLPILPDEDLRELFGGKFEGMTYEILRIRMPEEYGHWVRDIGTAVCPGGETMVQVQQRGDRALRRIAEQTPDGSTVLIGTHAAFIRTLMCRWKGLPPEEMKNIPWVANASVTEVGYENGKFTLLAENICDYLGDMRTDIPQGV